MGAFEPRIDFVHANGLRFEVAMCGDSDRLALCLHGFPEHYYSWRHQMPMLAELGYRVWAPNQRGYGFSSRPRPVDAYAMTHLLADVAGLIDAAGKRSTLLIGHDWGGAISWLFAQRRIRPLERMIILNAPHPLRMIESMMRFPQLLRSWYIFLFQIPWLPERLFGARGARAIGDAIRASAADPSHFSEAVLDVYRRNASHPGALTAMLNWYRAFMQHRMTAQERAALRTPIDTPTLLLWGEQDQALGKELTFGMEKLATNLTVRYLPNAAHWVQQEAPEEVNAAIKEWLAG